MLGAGSDADRNAGPLLSLAFPGHRNYIGGGKTPPPPVSQVRHSGALASTERASSRHLRVRQRGREEALTDGGRGDVGDCREGLPGLRKTV